MSPRSTRKRAEIRRVRRSVQKLGGLGLCVSSFLSAPASIMAAEPLPTAEGEAEAKEGEGETSNRDSDSGTNRPAVSEALAEGSPKITEEALSEKQEPSDKEPSAKHSGGKHKKSKHSILHGGNTGRLEVRGRVFALSELTRRRRSKIDLEDPEGTYNAWELSLASARMALDYEAPMPWLTAQVELELGDGISLKDGYIQARDDHFTVRAGQFKMPISPLEVESPWSLPTVRRGFMHRILNDWLDVGGRNPGLLVGIRDKHGIRPSLSAGVFQGRTLRRVPTATDRSMNRLGAVSLEAQSYVARAGIEVAHLALGAWYMYRVGSPALGETDRFHTAGFDATYDLPLPHGGLRVWADLIAGESWYRHAFKVGTDNPTFVEGRALVALRFGGVEEDEVYVEPFGMFGGFDADRDIRSDLAWEAAAGMNVGFWKRARLSLQAEINRTQENFPATFFPNGNVDRESLLLQAGVAW